MRISDWSSDVCSSDLRADFNDFDWLLCADHANLRDVQALGPDSGRARSTLFMEWAGLEGPIPDPYTGGDEHFEQVWAQVDEAAQAAVARLRGDWRIIPVRQQGNRDTPMDVSIAPEFPQSLEWLNIAEQSRKAT